MSPGIMLNEETLDAHAQPPERLRVLYKKFQKMSLNDMHKDLEMVDFLDTDEEKLEGKLKVVGTIDPSFLQFPSSNPCSANRKKSVPGSVQTFESLDVPGWALSSRRSINLTVQGFSFFLPSFHQLRSVI